MHGQFLFLPPTVSVSFQAALRRKRASGFFRGGVVLPCLAEAPELVPRPVPVPAETRAHPATLSLAHCSQHPEITEGQEAGPATAPSSCAWLRARHAPVSRMVVLPCTPQIATEFLPAETAAPAGHSRVAVPAALPGSAPFHARG